MIRLLLGVCVAAGAGFAAEPPDVARLLKGVEDRYNRLKTLQVTFTETYHYQGRNRRAESGELYLRKPGRMRWEYRQPAGKLFVSDGKDIYFYSPSANRVEKMKLKETEDMRAPLAFLLGKLDFSRDFNKYQVIPEEGAMKIVAYPKSDKLPYTQVEFTVGPDYRIKHLVVSGADTLEFQFEGEKLNPALSPNLFRFEAPQGAEFVDASGGSGRN